MPVTHSTTSALTDLLFDEPGIGRCLVAPDGSILRANAEWLRSTCFALDDVLGANVIDLFPESRDMALAMHARARAGHRVEVPRHAQRVNGRETWWEGSIVPIPMENGTGLLILTREVTAVASDSRSTSVAARPSSAPPLLRFEGILETFFANSPAIVNLLDDELRYLKTGRTTPTYFGLDRETIVGKRLQDLAPAFLERFGPVLRRVIETGEPALNVETFAELANRPGDVRRWRATYFRVPLPDGRRGLGVVGVEITDLKRAEEALRESEARLATVLDTVPAAVWIARDRLANDITANRFGAELLRARRGSNVSVTAPPDERPTNFRPMKQGKEIPPDELPIQAAARLGREIRDFEFDLVFDDGTVRHLLGNSSPIPDAAGGVGGSVGAFIDITTRKHAEARSESLARFPEENPHPVLRLDAALTVLYANQAARTGMVDIGLAADRPAPEPIAEPARRAMAERRRVSAELPCGGAVFAATFVPVGNEVNIYAHDVTARKHAEDALRASEEYARVNAAEAREVLDKLEATFAAMTQGIMVYGADGKVTRLNSAAEAILQPDASFRAAPGPEARVALVRLTTPEGAPFPVEETPAWRALHGESSRDVEMTFRRPSGELVWLSASGAPIRSQDGTLGGAVVTFSDVTDQRRTEAALRASEKELRAFVTASSDVLYRMSPDWSEMRQLRSGRFLADTDEPTTTWQQKYIHPDDQPRVSAAIQEVIRTGSTFELEHRVLRADGTIGWTFSRAIPLKDASGAITGWFGAATDVTDRKRAEEALRGAISDLEDADRRKTEFLAVLSHELRNPLAPILNSIHILERAAPGGEQASRAKQVVRRQTEHLTRLVDDLLDVMRIEHGKVVLRRTRVDLREVVQSTTDDLRSTFATAGVELHVDHVLGPVWIDADATRIAQVLGNLLHNAVKFTPRGGTVRVTLRTSAERAELRVRDSGVGMDAAMMARLFVPFSQAEQTLARTRGGLGLGLALVKGLVELHGGAVEARSDGVGSGAEFVIRLPLAETAMPAREPHLERPPGKGHLILVIEDNADAAETLADILRLDGHRVRIAPDGRAGLELAREVRPDVVLCDIGLPDIDGYEVARALRRDEAFQATRLVAVTGYAQPEDRQRARDAGFDAHIAKPPDPDELANVLGSER